MYRGFNLKLNDEINEFYNNGLEITNSIRTETRKSIDKYISADGTINGTDLQSNWFPNIKSDIFISHSHKDEKIAIALAGWLNKELGINAFIDSCVWGYSNDLLKSIDNIYCKRTDNDFYDYDKRNESTSHVHMMLTSALNMMIDSSECLFFLNTPSSISTNEIISKTKSPWIYSEIVSSKIIEKKEPKRPQRVTESFSSFEGGGKLEKALIVNYDVDLSHFTELDYNGLVSWSKQISNSIHSLDTLYHLFPAKSKKL